MTMAKQYKWNVYVMAGNTKFYLRKQMTTQEAIKWLDANCEHKNGNNFMCGHQVFCERK
jgi:hypothetical protein